MKLPFTLSRWVWLAAVGAAVLLAFGWVATTSGPLAPVKVTLTRVATGTITPSVFGIGTVEARRSYLIGPTVAGRVDRVLVDVGDRVKAGQLLAEMDAVDLDARVGSTSAAAARAWSAVATAQAQVHDARSRQALAAREALRYIDLGRQNFVSSSVVDAKLQLRQSADAQLAAAESVHVSARQDVTRLEADREGARRQRGNLRLEAPVDGVVTSRDAQPGSTVVAGQAGLRLIDPASLWVTTRFDQNRSAGLHDGLPGRITLRSSGARGAASGKVVRLEPTSDSVTEERIAQVVFDSLPLGASTGEMAEVLVSLPAVAGALVIPNAALHQRGAQSGVWRHGDGKLRFVSVRTGAEGADGMVEVIEGMRAGDEVVVHSDRELSAASRIKVVPALVETHK
jgi:HlyD family secretion protein